MHPNKTVEQTLRPLRLVCKVEVLNKFLSQTELNFKQNSTVIYNLTNIMYLSIINIFEKLIFIFKLFLVRCVEFCELFGFKLLNLVTTINNLILKCLFNYN